MLSIRWYEDDERVWQMAFDPFVAGDFEDAHVAGRSSVEEEREDDDHIVRGLLQAITSYRQGHHKGAIRNAVNAINEIATTHSVNGGGWY